MAGLVGRLRAACRERQKLIAHIDEGHAGGAAAERELEDPAVEVEGLVEVAHLDRHVIGSDETHHSEPG
jgi:hypothetical protein